LRHDPAYRVAELPFHQHCSVVEHRDDDHRARVHDVFALGGGAVGQAYGVAARLQETALVNRFGPDAGFGEMAVVLGHDEGLFMSMRRSLTSNIPSPASRKEGHR